LVEGIDSPRYRAQVDLVPDPAVGPKVEAAFLQGQDAGENLARRMFQFGRHFCLMAVGVLYHEEQIVARPPPELGMPFRHMIGPIADIVSAGHLVGMLGATDFRGAEYHEVGYDGILSPSVAADRVVWQEFADFHFNRRQDLADGVEGLRTGGVCEL